MCVTVRWMVQAERWVADTVRWVAEAERWVAVPRQRDVCHSELDGRGREMGGCCEAERWMSQ
jgi:hypothetical protein